LEQAPYDASRITVFRKTVTETDMVLFSGITGDSPATTPTRNTCGAPRTGPATSTGALIVGFMSTVAAKALEEARPEGLTPVSLGYDRIRFVKQVYPGQTLSVRYEFEAYDPETLRATANVEASVQDELVAVGQHVVKWVRSEAPVFRGIPEPVPGRSCSD
jgi:3-hydroxybutyryl-CoA dehydratase